jgi:hypothetical protein
MTLMNKSKFATVVLSVVPGLGHFYLGWMERGLQFMVAFFLSIFLISWLNLSLFGLLLPIIWFYSLFDALMHLSYGHPERTAPSPWSWLVEKQRWVGIGLISLGALLLINRMVIPMLQIYLDYQTVRMISTAAVALLFIAGGIRLALGRQITLPAERNGEPAEGQLLTGKDEE